MKLSAATLFVDSVECDTYNSNHACWEVDAASANIEIKFWPWKIKPLLRINSFLIDHWLGNVLLQDHAVTLTVDQHFFEQYRSKDLQGRLDSLGPNPTKVTVDRIVGRNLHNDLVLEIQKRLNEKSYSS